MSMWFYILSAIHFISTQQWFLINWKAERGFGKSRWNVNYFTDVHPQMTSKLNFSS